MRFEGPFYPNSINDAGYMIGTKGVEVSPYLFYDENRDRQVQDSELTPLLESADHYWLSLTELNNRKQVVGFLQESTYSKQRALLWSEGTLYELNELIPPTPGVHLLEGIAINDQGWILCHGEYKGFENNYRSYLLVPAELAGVGNAYEYR